MEAPKTKNSQYARSLLEASLDPLVTISAEGKITDVNNASIKVTGISREKLINTDFSNYFTDPKKAQEGYLQVFEKGFVEDYPLTIKHKNGTLTDVSYNASVYKDKKGNVLGVFASARDVTDQEWAIELRKANKELAFQNNEKEKRADELSIANTELAFQNDEKEKRANELIIANKELAFQNDEKEKRAAELVIANTELAFQNDEKEKRADELIIANTELAFQNNEKEKRADELIIANKELAFQNDEKEKRAAELVIANTELAFQNDEKEKRAGELSIANTELAFQNNEKEKRADELGIANTELAYQNDEKEKRAAELVIANTELAFQNDEKEKRADELSIANKELAFQNDEKEKRAAELVIANTELAFQNNEKEKRAQELSIANKELAFQNDEKEKRSSELSIANTELAFQNDEKEKRAAELVIANTELAFQNNEKEKRADELIIANTELAFQNDEKEKRAAELGIANKELAFQNDEKEKRAAELVIANKELAFQNKVKEKRAAELVIANEELAFQNNEKEKRAAELGIANKELIFQTKEKQKRAAELVIADIELDLQNIEKEKREIANKKLESLSYSAKLASQYSLSLIEASLDPLVTISSKGKITDMNQALANITGLTREELTDTDFLNYFTEPQKAREVYQEVFAKGSVADSPLTIRHKDGKLTDVLFNGSVYKDDLGNVMGIVIVARDVTAQKLLSKYSLSLIEASLDPLITINTGGKITDINEATVNITGITREKLKGTDFFDYFTNPQKAREVYQEVFANGSVSNSPLTLRHKKGKLTDVLFNGSVYKDDNGNVLGIVIVARDVTEQNKIATELNEAIVFAELATEIAEQAKIKAESAVKAKQQFLSNMSHEIRTPMNAIIGFTKVVLKTELTAKQKEYLSAIKISGNALIVLINDILDLAKVESGKMVFEEIPFKLAQSISAMLHVFESKIWEKNIKLIKEYDTKIPQVLVGDPVRLHQIILNLVSNAVKFTSKGKITVSVRLIHEDKDSVKIEFAVTDTGIGIPENKIGKIFENFQQASSGTSRLYGGTGLGLAIVKQLVEPQGGSIHVKSKVGEGSCFSFVLNFLKTTEKAEMETNVVELDTDIKNIKILVVEDIPLNQLLMKTLLDDFGFGNDVASNGKIAIEKLESSAYDLILMDLQMPEMNGFEATDYIRNQMKSKIPIIALTADVTTVDLAKCKEVGMDDYIAKPVDDQLLYSKIVGFLKKSMPVGELPSHEIDPDEKTKCTDLDYLYRRTKSNPALMMEMISLYLEQTPPLIDTMKKSLKNKDWETLHTAVHKIIPSFTIMGISVDFENMAKKVQEYASTQKQTDGIPILMMQLEEVCMQACDELEEEFNAIKNNI